MNLRIAAFVVFFVALAASDPGYYYIVNTWADENCSTVQAAKFVVQSFPICAGLIKKRESQQSSCQNFNGVYYTIDASYCSSSTAPPFPDGWQVVRWGGSNDCSSTDQFVLGASSLDRTLVAMIRENSVGWFVVNATMACDDTALAFSYCENAVCRDFSLENSVCQGDTETNSVFAFQTTCGTIPVPVGVPITTPIDTPIAAPVDTPVNTPSSSPSSTPVTTPESTPESVPVSNPISGPISTPVTSPVRNTTPRAKISGVSVVLGSSAVIASFIALL
jgi:hypothetical protein